MGQNRISNLIKYFRPSIFKVLVGFETSCIESYHWYEAKIFLRKFRKIRGFYSDKKHLLPSKNTNVQEFRENKIWTLRLSEFSQIETCHVSSWHHSILRKNGMIVACEISWPSDSIILTFNQIQNLSEIYFLDPPKIQIETCHVSSWQYSNLWSFCLIVACEIFNPF